MVLYVTSNDTVVFIEATRMKILRIKVNGLPLYKDAFDVSFYAVQRIQEN